MTQATRPTLTVFNVKALVPAEWGRKLARLSADLGVPRGELIAEALVLLFRHHGHGEGLPEPTPPVDAQQTKGEAGR